MNDALIEKIALAACESCGYMDRDVYVNVLKWAIREYAAQNAATQDEISEHGGASPNSHSPAVAAPDAQMPEKSKDTLFYESPEWTKMKNKMLLSAHARIEQLEAALAEAQSRLHWIRHNLFTHSWNGVVGPGCRTTWTIAGNWRHVVSKMVNNGDADFDAAIDAARRTNEMSDKLIEKIGFAQEMANGKLSFTETTLPASELHDNGRPLYVLYRSVAAIDAAKEKK